MARCPPRTAPPSQPPGAPGPYASSWSKRGRPARWTVKPAEEGARFFAVAAEDLFLAQHEPPGGGDFDAGPHPQIAAVRGDELFGQPVQPGVLPHGQPHVVTGGLGAPSGLPALLWTDPPRTGPPWTVPPTARPGRATVAAAASTVSRAPSRTSASIASRSPPSGALIAPTTVTRLPGPRARVRRTASGPSPVSTGSPSRVATIRAVAWTLMRSRRRGARAPSP